MAEQQKLTCGECLDLITSGRRGTSMVIEHLEICESCRQLAEEIASLKNLKSAYLTPPSDALVERMMQKIPFPQESADSKERVSQLGMNLKYAISAMFLLIVYAASFVYFRNNSVTLPQTAFRDFQVNFITENKSSSYEFGSEINSSNGIVICKISSSSCAEIASNSTISIGSTSSEIKQGTAKFTIENASQPYTLHADGLIIPVKNAIITVSIASDSVDLRVLSGEISANISGQKGSTINLKSGTEKKFQIKRNSKFSSTTSINPELDIIKNEQ
ncbi:MAG: hypothetical protein HQM08_01185 [Candidatus Riflebacteria bacterium]|nr:hypothetical protein [Candidatus Riflebacteria bacterium]